MSRLTSRSSRRARDRFAIEPCEPRTFLSASPTIEAPVESLLYAPDETIAGKTQERLSAEWWQWAFSYDADRSPFTDDGPVAAGLGDVGNVFFLAGNISGGPSVRDVVVPSDTPIFVPIANGEWSVAEDYHFDFFGQPTLDDKNPREQIETLRGIVEGWFGEYVGDVYQLYPQPTAYFSIDGDGMTGDQIAPKYFQEAVGFKFAIAATNNVWGVELTRDDPLPTPAVSAGYWVGIKPLATGDHTIEFGNDWLQVTYNVTVVSPQEYKAYIKEQTGAASVMPQKPHPFSRQPVTPDSVLGGGDDLLA